MFKLIVEFGPLIVFLMTYKYSDIFLATALMVLSTMICLLISYLIDKKVSALLLVSSVILLILGAVTLMTGDSMYIKIKPTIAYLILSGILYFGIRKNKPLMKNVMGEVVSMNHESWMTLSKRFALYLLGMAVLNEFIWRNFSESTWVTFKVFGMFPITLVFVGLQVPFIMKSTDNKSE